MSPDDVERWASAGIEALGRFGVVRFGIGALRFDEAESRALARALAGAVLRLLLAAGAPAKLEQEVAEATEKAVTAGNQCRTLLPHHDGGRVSFLLASTADTSGVGGKTRLICDWEGRSPAVKLFSGFFVKEPGAALSVTTFYPMLRVVAEACARSTGTAPTLERTACWLAANVSRFEQLRAAIGATYLTLPAALGAASKIHLAVARNNAETPFPPETYGLFPDLAGISKRCTCGACRTPVEQLLCSGLHESMQLSWSEFRSSFEFCVTTERFDFLLWNNVVLRHGGLCGGVGRALESIYFTLSQPLDGDFDVWLGQQWRKGPRSPWVS